MFSSQALLAIAMANTPQRVNIQDWDQNINPDNWEERELYDLLVYEPRADRPGKLKMSGNSSTSIKPEDVTSSLGDFGRFPREILDMIIDAMDFFTVTKFSNLCMGASYIVAQHSAYNDILKFASHVPEIMRDTQGNRYHSMRAIQNQIRTRECVSCGEFGTCLFLPTCERICMTCLKFNQAYWTLQWRMALDVFAVTKEDLVRNIPVMLPLIRRDKSKSRNLPHQVAVKSVLKLALAVHGSLQNIKLNAGNSMPVPYSDPTMHEIALAQLYDFLRHAPLKRLTFSPAELPGSPPLSPSIYFPTMFGSDLIDRIHDPGVAAAQLAYVPRAESEVQKALYCKGCHWLITNFRWRQYVPKEELAKMRPSSGGSVASYQSREFLHQAMKARTWSEMMQHARTECWGGWYLMNQHRIVRQGSNQQG